MSAKKSAKDDHRKEPLKPDDLRGLATRLNVVAATLKKIADSIQSSGGPIDVDGYKMFMRAMPYVEGFGLHAQKAHLKWLDKNK